MTNGENVESGEPRLAAIREQLKLLADYL